jgi:hypothetical protein
MAEMNVSQERMEAKIGVEIKINQEEMKTHRERTEAKTDDGQE